MSTFNIPILPFFVNIFIKTTQLSSRRKQCNSPPELENQNHCRSKTTQLSMRKTTQLCSRNKTTQLRCRGKQFNSPLNSKTKTIAGGKQLTSAAGKKQLNSAGENNSPRQQE
ncbi:hypothetical protein TNCV_4044911 [Trichonephila clavipes]|nr:hypothetical protein TNCV_4044911 [Trichonephila clavipes]